MPATMQAFEHFVKTGRTDYSPPKESSMPKYKAGDTVEFDSDAEDGVPLTGKILNYLLPDGKFKGGYHIACYYVVGEEDLRLLSSGSEESPGEIWARLSEEGRSETQIASFLGVSVQTLRSITSGYSAF